LKVNNEKTPVVDKSLQAAVEVWVDVRMLVENRLSASDPRECVVNKLAGRSIASRRPRLTQVYVAVCDLIILGH